MREYEIVYIFNPALDEEAITAKLDRFHGLVTGGEGAEVSEVDHWGVRQLAYPVRKQGQGYYVVAQFTANPSDLTEFERIIKLDDDVLRFLVVLSEGAPTSGMSVMAEVPESVRDREDDDDDDDDEDEDDEDDEFGHPEGSPPVFSGGRGRRRRVEGPKIELLNFKDVSTLSRFVTEQGKILPKRTTKVTARFQRQLGTAVKRARYLALLPYVQNHER